MGVIKRDALDNGAYKEPPIFGTTGYVKALTEGMSQGECPRGVLVRGSSISFLV